MLTSIFGGELPWSSRDWTSSNDTVRGGKSSSSFKFIESNSVAIFSGYLDVSTLGGAGFASQRTKGNDRVWDLSNYDGIVLNIKKADGKKYTFSLKDQVVAPTQSSISWDYNFITTGDEQVKIFWSDLEPTYRGRVLEDTTPLNLKEIRGFSLMMRSFFGFQEGRFALSLSSISAFTTKYEPYQDNFSDDAISYLEKISEKDNHDFTPPSQTWLNKYFGGCIGRR